MEDLDMSTQDFATAISILFVGYLPFQLPSNLIISRLTRPGLCGSSHTTIQASTDIRYLLCLYDLGIDLRMYGRRPILRGSFGRASTARCLGGCLFPWSYLPLEQLVRKERTRGSNSRSERSPQKKPKTIYCRY